MNYKNLKESSKRILKNSKNQILYETQSKNDVSKELNLLKREKINEWIEKDLRSNKTKEGSIQNTDKNSKFIRNNQNERKSNGRVEEILARRSLRNTQGESKKIPDFVTISFSNAIEIKLFTFVDNNSYDKTNQETYKLDLKLKTSNLKASNQALDIEEDIIYSSEWKEKHIYEVVYKSIFIDRTLNWRLNSLNSSEQTLSDTEDGKQFLDSLNELNKSSTRSEIVRSKNAISKSDQNDNSSPFPNTIFLKIVYRLRDRLGMVYWLELKRENSEDNSLLDSKYIQNYLAQGYEEHRFSENSPFELSVDFQDDKSNDIINQSIPIDIVDDDIFEGKFQNNVNISGDYYNSNNYVNDNGTPEEVRQWKELRKSNKSSFKRKHHLTSLNVNVPSDEDENFFMKTHEESLSSLLIDDIERETTFSTQDKSNDFGSSSFKIHQKAKVENIFNLQKNDYSEINKELENENIFFKSKDENNSQREFNNSTAKVSSNIHSFQTGALEFDQSVHTRKTVDVLWEELIQTNMRQKEQQIVISDLQHRLSQLESSVSDIRKKYRPGNDSPLSAKLATNDTSITASTGTTFFSTKPISPSRLSIDQMRRTSLIEKRNDETIESRIHSVSSIILPSLFLTENEKNKLCFELGNNNWNLLYRASRDGFDAITFHEKCDFRPYTLTIIKPLHEKFVIGGYTPIPWKSPDPSPRFVQDNRISIFSLQYGELKITKPSKSSCMHSSDLLPSFGDGDIVLVDRGNIHSCNSSVFFQDKKGKFYCEDVEVFQIIRREVPVPRMSDSRL